MRQPSGLSVFGPTRATFGPPDGRHDHCPRGTCHPSAREAFLPSGTGRFLASCSLRCLRWTVPGHALGLYAARIVATSSAQGRTPHRPQAGWGRPLPSPPGLRRAQDAGASARLVARVAIPRGRGWTRPAEFVTPTRQRRRPPPNQHPGEAWSSYAFPTCSAARSPRSAALSSPPSSGSSGPSPARA
jgi:hypothetical protein